MAQEAKPAKYDMTYPELAGLCRKIEDYLSGQPIGKNIHDIASPLASITRDYVSDFANLYYENAFRKLTESHESMVKSIKAEILANIKKALEDK